jgi:serine/threonine protein kinase
VSLAPLPNLIGERYRPIRLLGRGGGGAVYEAEHLHTGARVALKLVAGFEGASADAVARFRREARLAAAIDSEHVVRITDAGTADELGGTPFLVMELMQGHTLEQEAHHPVPPERSVELLSQVARALERAHAAGIVHRDLKPENVFLTQREDGRPLVKVLDFGIAKRTHGVTHDGSTEQGTVLGTPMYMAPEQAQGQGALIDSRTDTWALGMITFRLLFGLPYFAPDSTWRLIHRVVFEPVVAPSSLGFVATPAFDAWFLRSCSHDRAERFTSPAAQIRELAEALKGLERVEIQRQILDARAQRSSASTEEQSPEDLREELLKRFSAPPGAPWSDGPLVEAQSSDSGRRAPMVALAESTPPNLPSVAPTTTSRFGPSRTTIPLALVLVLLVVGSVWLWRITRPVSLTDETTGPTVQRDRADTADSPKTGSAAEEGIAHPVPGVQAGDGLATGAPDAAMPQPKPVPVPTAPKPERPSGRVRGAAGHPVQYDPLGDRH